MNGRMGVIPDRLCCNTEQGNRGKQTSPPCAQVKDVETQADRHIETNRHDTQTHCSQYFASMSEDEVTTNNTD